jgi:hypothetical protein
MKRIHFLLMVLVASFTLKSCTDADVVSRNISVEAGNFKVNRRVIFYNGITDTYMLAVEGRCQIDHGTITSVTCKVGEDAYKKHYLHISDNVTYFVEQLEPSEVGVYSYKVIFKPQVIIPDVVVKVK